MILKRIFRYALVSLSIALSIVMILPVNAGAQLFDDSVDQACAGLTEGSGCNDEQAGSTIDSTLATVINIFSFIVGFAAVIMMIIGGLRYITSGGDSNSVNGAKNTILYAVIGLVVVALAQIIVQFVLDRI